MRRVIIHPPAVAEHEVLVRWTVVPPSDLYRIERFHLRFPDDVSLRGVPEALWWTVALLCLHAHWPLLRPCRVELPVELPHGEREFWLRLLDRAVTTLELTWGGGDLARTIEISDVGPRLARHAPAGERLGMATAFSGGKDSLLQLGLLAEFGERPIAVTTTSPHPGMFDHLTTRRRGVLDAIAARPDIEHVEVHSDFRACWDHLFPRRRGYQIAVGPLTDTFLYLAAALVVGWVRGARGVLLASEAELQESARHGERIVEHPHFMYSAATQQAIDALLSRDGLRHGSLNYPLHAWHAERLLWARYPDLRELQYSCWRVGAENEAACNACSDCLRTALTVIQAGGAPGRIGLDMPRLLNRMRDWEPATAVAADGPNERVRASLHAQLARQVAATPTRAVARGMVAERRRRLAEPTTFRALRSYRALRRRVGPTAAPDPGYRSAYLALIDPRLRDRLAAIYDEAFTRAPAAEDAELLARTRSLSSWITSPLQART